MVFLPWSGNPDGGRAQWHGLAAHPVSSLPGQVGSSHPPVARPGRGQAVPVPDKPEAGIRGHSDSVDVAGGSVLAGDHHVHLSVDSADDVFELGYILLQRIDVG